MFNPILHTSPDGSSEAERRSLQDVQDRARNEKERFHHYGSAEEIIEDAKSDLHSPTGSWKNEAPYAAVRRRRVSAGRRRKGTHALMRRGTYLYQSGS